MIGNIKAKSLLITCSRKTEGLQASKDRKTLITLITLRFSEELGEVLSWLCADVVPPGLPLFRTHSFSLLCAEVSTLG